MEKVLDWAALQTEEGKFALGYILVEELNQQISSKNRNILHGVSVFLDIEGQVKISPQECPLSTEFKQKPIEEQIRTFLKKGLSESAIMQLINSQ